MKRLAIALTVLLASCSPPTGTIGTTGITYEQVKAEAIKDCHYVPSINEVAQLIPYFGTAVQLVQGMCNVLLASAATAGAQTYGFVSAPTHPTLKGVPLTGHFVKP